MEAKPKRASISEPSLTKRSSAALICQQFFHRVFKSGSGEELAVRVPRVFGVGLLLGSITCSPALSQTKTQVGPAPLPSGPPGGLPGYRPVMPSMPSPQNAPAIDTPARSPFPSAPSAQPPAVVVPPPGAGNALPKNGGGPSECDCYQVLQTPILDPQGRILRYEPRRVLTGKSNACSPL